MNSIPNIFRAAVAAAIALGLMFAGALFAMCLFVAVLVLVAGGTVRTLLSGRKPAPFVIWERWRDLQGRSSRFASQMRGRPGFERERSAKAAAADVVDVQARDVP